MAQPPDLAEADRPVEMVVLDTQMPGMSGAAVAEAIRSDVSFGRPGIVLLGP